MKELYYTDESLKDDEAYQDFLKNNPSKGYVKIRASAANEAIPISGIKIKVTKVIGENIIIFYEGVTDYSGMINDIVLPAPSKTTDDEVAPKFTYYDMSATGSVQNLNQEYGISVCCGITVIQYINVTPTINEIRNCYGS